MRGTDPPGGVPAWASGSLKNTTAQINKRMNNQTQKQINKKTNKQTNKQTIKQQTNTNAEHVHIVGIVT